ncbi:MAG: ribosomal protein S18-alanine N-acetyltransferase [Bacillota bacterium]
MQERIIRPMTVADIDQVLGIEALSFPTPWSRFAFTSELTQNTYAYYMVADVDGAVVAYAGVWVVLEEGHITNVAVHPKFRGQGLGEQMMLAIMGRAKAKGAERVTLEVRVSNDVAHNLYTKLGFVDRGLRKGYYTDTKEDAIIMWKDNLDDIPALGEDEDCVDA